MKLLEFLVLPPEISEFERRYLQRVNRVALAFFALHVPVFVLVAWANRTGPWLALALTSAVLAGPAIAVHKLANPRTVSVVHGIAAMFFGGLLVHFGQGPLQIEMHFYFFCLLAMCAVFGNPMVILAGAATVALHHLVVWLVLPKSVFNYSAAWWVVAVHAAFVVLESIPACYIARSFFDNVIGLEKIVQARTAALDARNRDMRLLLDNVRQGFLTIGADGSLAKERSAAVDRWLGAPAEGDSWFDYLGRVSQSFADGSRAAWDQVRRDVLPLDVALDLMPHTLKLAGAHLQLDYRPIGASEPYEHYLVVITDVTAELAREQAEIERREAMEVFERILNDRTGTESFFDEGSRIVAGLTKAGEGDLPLVKRLVHTLKGNATLFGLDSVATLCHALEDRMAEEDRTPPPEAYGALLERWARLAGDVARIVGGRGHGIEVDEAGYVTLEKAVRRREAYGALLERVHSLRYEPVTKRFAQFAEQARRIALRLDKGDLSVIIEDYGVRIDPGTSASLWASFIHAVRNAVDHGIESPSARVLAKKAPRGTLVLRANEDEDRIVLEVVDDGKGIDWGAVRERALEQGLPVATKADLEAALFTDGISTAASVTDISGRGIGMGALAHDVRALGGQVTVESSSAGTTVRMTLPREPAPRRESVRPVAAGRGVSIEGAHN
jgi:two-component system chemotaxis sensor kinase CheA